MHVSPVARRKRGRLAAGAVLMALVPLVAGVWYFAYNVGAVSVLVADGTGGQFSSLDVTFSEVALHSTGALTATSWVALDLETQTLNLTALRGNTSMLIGSDKVPAGRYTQARIVVDSAVGVLKSGEAVSITVPTGELRTTHPFDLAPQDEVTILVRLHVVKTALGYHLEPVVGSVMGG